MDMSDFVESEAFPRNGVELSLESLQRGSAACRRWVSRLLGRSSFWKHVRRFVSDSQADLLSELLRPIRR